MKTLYAHKHYKQQITVTPVLPKEKQKSSLTNMHSFDIPNKISSQLNNKISSGKNVKNIEFISNEIQDIHISKVYFLKYTNVSNEICLKFNTIEPKISYH